MLDFAVCITQICVHGVIVPGLIVPDVFGVDFIIRVLRTSSDQAGESRTDKGFCILHVSKKCAGLPGNATGNVYQKSMLIIKHPSSGNAQNGIRGLQRPVTYSEEAGVLNVQI